MLAYIDICYVTIELAHISIVLFARVSLLIFVSSWTLFWTGLPWKRCGHILFGFLSPFLPPPAPSISDCYGTSHCHIQVTEERWTVNLHALLQPGQIHCSVPPLPSLHRPGLIVQRTTTWFKTIKKGNKNNIICIFQGCFAAFIRGPKRKSMIVYMVCILVPSLLYSLPHFFEHKVDRSKLWYLGIMSSLIGQARWKWIDSERQQRISCNRRGFYSKNILC